MVCYTEQVVLNYCVLCWTYGCESWCVMRSKWLWVMVRFAEPVVVNHGVSCWASCCESCCVKLSQWLWIMMCYSEPMVVKHGLLCCAKCCESWCLKLSPLVVIHDALSWAKCLLIMIRYAEPSGCESWCAIPNQWLCIMVCYAEQVVVNDVLLCWASGSGSWCIMLSQCLWIMVS
jgi:hypothetical protein